MIHFSFRCFLVDWSCIAKIYFLKLDVRVFFYRNLFWSFGFNCLLRSESLLFSLTFEVKKECKHFGDAGYESASDDSVFSQVVKWISSASDDDVWAEHMRWCRSSTKMDLAHSLFPYSQAVLQRSLIRVNLVHFHGLVHFVGLSAWLGLCNPVISSTVLHYSNQSMCASFSLMLLL